MTNNFFVNAKTSRRFIQVVFLFAALFCNSTILIASKSSLPDSHYDSIYHVMTTSTDKADFKSFYEVVRLDEHFPENLKYELILITTKKAKKLGFDHSYASGLFYQSIYKSIGGEYREAISMASISLAIFQNLEDHTQLSACYNTLGSTLTANGDPETGKEYLRKAMQENELVKNLKRKLIDRINNLIVMGYVYFNANQLDSAEIFTRQALQEANENSLPEVSAYNLYKEKAYCHINLGKFQLTRGNYNKAVELYKKGLEFCEKGSFKDLEATFHHRIGQTYQLKNDWENALSHFDKGIELCDNYFTFLPIWIDLLEIKAETLQKTGNYNQAVEVQKKHILLKDSLNTINKEKELQRLVIEFEVEQKDQEIASLNQQATIQSLRLSQQNNQLLVITLFSLTAILGGFLYYRQFKFKKERIAFELKQRFLRSQLNPHFIFNSMTSIQSYLVNTDTENAGRYMGMFSSLMRQILENSREEFIPLAEEVSMLKNYIELQRIRFSEPFEYHIEVDEAIDEVYMGIPPMFAQPFIENAFEHGLFKEKGKENKLNVIFSMTSPTQVLLEIEDTGIGVNWAMPEKNHKSMATRITEERLQNLNYSSSQKNGLQSENLIGKGGYTKGYRIKLLLPLKVLSYS
ncbi:tetratricopeptide repeat-containing sensor histidine kinase [Ekhidna sp.]